jgi:hypothetical protein
VILVQNRKNIDGCSSDNLMLSKNSYISNFFKLVWGYRRNRFSFIYFIKIEMRRAGLKLLLFIDNFSMFKVTLQI